MFHVCLIFLPSWCELYLPEGNNESKVCNYKTIKLLSHIHIEKRRHKGLVLPALRGSRIQCSRVLIKRLRVLEP